MLLDLVGGTMNPAPDWALSVAELETIGLTTQAARQVAGVSPGFALEGEWVVLLDEQPYDAGSARMIEVRADAASCNSGAVGTVSRVPKKAIIRFPAADGEHDEECLVIRAAESSGFATGTIYTGHDLPAGDPGTLWDIDDADEEDAREKPAARSVRLYRLETIEHQLSDTRTRALAEASDEGEW